MLKTVLFFLFYKIPRIKDDVILSVTIELLWPGDFFKLFQFLIDTKKSSGIIMYKNVH